jgi:hypothetical protein
MSERQTRAKEAVVILQRLSKVRELKRADEAEEKALLIAHAALAEEPRALIFCDGVLQYARISLAVENLACSECGETVMGWEDKWTGCPVCLSKFKSITRENSPEDRLTRKAVKEAMEGVYA